MDLGTERDEIIRGWYDLYRQDIYRFARYTLGNAAEAYDVVQETFLRVIRFWDYYQHNASPKTWLITIARNYMRDVMKRKSRERRAMQSFGHAQLFADEGCQEEQLYLEESLLTLKETYRQVFVLRHVEELSIQDTAQILGWSESKVTTTDHRAITKLRQAFGISVKGVDNA